MAPRSFASAPRRRAPVVIPLRPLIVWTDEADAALALRDTWQALGLQRAAVRYAPAFRPDEIEPARAIAFFNAGREAEIRDAYVGIPVLVIDDDADRRRQTIQNAISINVLNEVSTPPPPIEVAVEQSVADFSAPGMSPDAILLEVTSLRSRINPDDFERLNLTIASVLISAPNERPEALRAAAAALACACETPHGDRVAEWLRRR